MEGLEVGGGWSVAGMQGRGEEQKSTRTLSDFPDCRRRMEQDSVPGCQQAQPKPYK